MFLRFDTTKTIQAIGVMLREHRAQLATKDRVLNLLYIADRESIQERGWPVLGSKTVAIEHGPVHCFALDLISGTHGDEPQFSAHFDVKGNFVQMMNDPGVGRLSRADIEKLKEVCHQYACVSDWNLSKHVTQGFPEWAECYREGTSHTIPIEAIIRAVCRSDDIESILADLRQEHDADLAFGRVSM